MNSVIQSGSGALDPADNEEVKLLKSMMGTLQAQFNQAIEQRDELHSRLDNYLQNPCSSDVLEGLYQAWHKLPPCNLMALIGNAIQEIQATNALLETAKNQARRTALEDIGALATVGATYPELMEYLQSELALLNDNSAQQKSSESMNRQRG